MSVGVRSIQKGREERHKKGGGESNCRIGTALSGASLFCVIFLYPLCSVRQDTSRMDLPGSPVFC